MAEQKVCLTIAGLDPSGGAGIIADIKTFSAFGCFAAAAITSITFQNTTGVFGAVHSDAATVRGQVDAVMDDLNVAAMKTGMLPTRETIEETAAIVEERAVELLVVDPVVRSTSGYDLIDDAALRVLIEKLFPASLLVTPNIQEAERISGISIRTSDDVEAAAKRMLEMGAPNVLMKGGHFDRSVEGGKARDVLYGADGSAQVFEADYIETKATHGTGCTLAAAITANLALGRDLTDAVASAKQFVTEAIRTASGLGRGHSPINIQPASF
jgi:hydroxymethylpyrimidine kinase/phosphomethylpyrimidine kinase